MAKRGEYEPLLAAEVRAVFEACMEARSGRVSDEVITMRTPFFKPCSRSTYERSTGIFRAVGTSKAAGKKTKCWLPLPVVVAVIAMCPAAVGLSIAETEAPIARPSEDFLFSDPVLPHYPARTTREPTSITTASSTVSTATPVQSPSACTTGKPFADPETCVRFFVCVEGRPFTMQCPGPLLFDDKKGICDWPRNVRCDANRPVTARARGVASDRWGRVSCVASEGFYASPRDCAEFFRCHRGRAHRFVCSPGLVFNDLYKTCDWPWNVKDKGVSRGFRACKFGKRWLVVNNFTT